MPSVSVAQRRLFAIAEKHPDQLYDKNRGLARLPHQTLHDFAATSEKHLPQYKADGMTNTAWRQSEPTDKKRPDWMEKAVPHMAAGGNLKKMPTVGAYRVKKAVADSAPKPRTRQYFKAAW